MSGSFVTGEVLLFDAGGNALVMTATGEAKVEAIQRAGVQFEQIIVDPTTPANKVGVTATGEAKTEVIQKAGELFKNLIVDETTPANSAGVTSENKLKVESSQVAGEAANVIITDPDNINRQAAVSAGGNLQVITPPPQPPPTATAANDTQYSGIGSTTDTFFTIPNTRTLFINRFISGAEASTKGSVAELYFDINGDLSVLEIIAVQFLSGSNASSDLAAVYDGDGTARIVMRRRRLDGGNVEFFASWIGYVEDTV